VSGGHGIRPRDRVGDATFHLKSGSRSGTFLRRTLLFRPSAFLRCGDPRPCFSTQSALLSGQPRLSRRIST